jgi:hypothetical protein
VTVPAERLTTVRELILKTVADHDGQLEAGQLIEMLVPPQWPTEAEVKRALWQLISEEKIDLGSGLRLVVGPPS